jgi:ribosomal protein S18 acetylase RimI-like enzyme
MTPAIRRLGPGDEVMLERLARDAPEFDLAGRSEPDEPLAPADAAAYLAGESVLHWIAEEQGRVVGELLCHVLPIPHGAGRELLLYSIGVREGDRRRGVGRALVDVMARWAEGAGVREVWVLADNPAAEAFYQACGFVRGADHEQGVLYLLDVPG